MSAVELVSCIRMCLPRYLCIGLCRCYCLCCLFGLQIDYLRVGELPSDPVTALGFLLRANRLVEACRLVQYLGECFRDGFASGPKRLSIHRSKEEGRRGNPKSGEWLGAVPPTQQTRVIRDAFLTVALPLVLQVRQGVYVHQIGGDESLLLGVTAPDTCWEMSCT